MKECSYKIKLPEWMYDKVSAKVEKRGTTASDYIRQLIVDDLGEKDSEVQVPIQAKDVGRPKGTAKEKRTAELYMRWGTGDMDGLHPYLLERPPAEVALRRFFLPEAKQVAIQVAAQEYLAEQLKVMGAEQFCRLSMDWTKKHMDEYPEWRDEDGADRAHLIRDMLNDLYLLANPE